MSRAAVAQQAVSSVDANGHATDLSLYEFVRRNLKTRLIPRSNIVGETQYEDHLRTCDSCYKRLLKTQWMQPETILEVAARIGGDY
jgi:hypothetical protein